MQKEKRMSGLRVKSRRLVLLAVALALPAQAQTHDAPHYKVDPFWPGQLPNKWIMGQVGGIAVDSQDHIWVLQRPRSATPDELGAAQNPPRSDCCMATPAVLEFDTAGNVINSWGGPNFVKDWPTTEHAIWVDKGGASGSVEPASMIARFSSLRLMATKFWRSGASRKNLKTIRTQPCWAGPPPSK